MIPTIANNKAYPTYEQAVQALEVFNKELKRRKIKVRTIVKEIETEIHLEYE